MTETIEQQAERIKIEMTKGNWNDSVEVLAKLLRELAAARAVADAAVAYFDHSESVSELYAEAFCALDDAVREYRARAESNGKEKGE